MSEILSLLPRHAHFQREVQVLIVLATSALLHPVYILGKRDYF